MICRLSGLLLVFMVRRIACTAVSLEPKDVTPLERRRGGFSCRGFIRSLPLEKPHPENLSPAVCQIQTALHEAQQAGDGNQSGAEHFAGHVHPGTQE